MKKSVLYFLAAIAATAAQAVTTTLEYEDLREAESRAAVSNEIARAAGAAVQSATNYTDGVATILRGEIAAATPEDYDTVKSNATVAAEAVAGLGDLAWLDGLEWSAIINRPTTWAWSAISGKPTTWAWSNISDKPSWIGATKPSYSLNDVCPDIENWLGVPGTTAAGKSIKVLAKTVNGVIEGGLTVTGSSNNDNNTTKFRYGGVTVTRSGTATDYLFDTSSQSGIVRRSELAGVTSAVSSLSNNVVTVSNLIAAVAHEWSATNTTAVIACHTGKETVSVPSGGNLVANLSGWNDGVQTFVVLQPSGAYTVASNVKYCGYGNWPTNTALCVAWPYAGTLYVNPIIIIRE